MPNLLLKFIQWFWRIFFLDIANIYVAIFSLIKKSMVLHSNKIQSHSFIHYKRIFSKSSLYFIICLLSFLGKKNDLSFERLLPKDALYHVLLKLVLRFWRNIVNVFSLCPYHLPPPPGKERDHILRSKMRCANFY